MGRAQRPQGPSFSAEGMAGNGDDADDREAIRARDERERDLAVQQRRGTAERISANKPPAVEAERQQQQRAQRETQEKDKKNADKESEKVSWWVIRFCRTITDTVRWAKSPHGQTNVAIFS